MQQSQEAKQQLTLRILQLSDNLINYGLLCFCTAALFGAFMRGNKPLVLPGEEDGFSKAKTGELNASPDSLDK